MQKILIVEDELPLLKIMTDRFSEQNFMVLTAQNGADGLQLALREHPNLILLDINMPVMNGIAMMEKLREDAWGSTVPVMILTNINDSASISTCLKYKIAKFYMKADWKLDDVVSEVKEKLPVIQRLHQEYGQKEAVS